MRNGPKPCRTRGSARRGWWLLGAWLLVQSGVAAAATEADLRSRVDAMYARYEQESFPGVAAVDPEQARVLVAEQAALWLDVRSARERAVSIVPGALDRETYEARPALWKGRPVIVYCTIGYRSGKATEELRSEGVEAYNLAGGVLAWILEGGTLVDPETGDPTHRVHVYGRRWNLVPPDWQAVW